MNVIKFSIPLHTLFLAVLILGIGITGGVGIYTFYYANGFSYMSSKPQVCINCHIMEPQFNSWKRASHHKAAGCVDCHLPHNLVSKYIAKGENGYHHSKAFTLGNFHEPIMIKEKNSRILQENCIHCHAGMVQNMREMNAQGSFPERTCVHCHSSVGHGETAGLGGPLHENHSSQE